MAKVKDRFDGLPNEPGRVGAHRGAIRRGGGWLGVLLIVLGIVALTAAGLFAADKALRAGGGKGLDFDFPFLPKFTATPSATPTTPPPVTADPAVAVTRGLSIMVLNGTSVEDLGSQTGGSLAAAGWPISTTGTTSRQIEDTVVYYADPANADLARGLVQVLGFGEARQVSPTVYPDQDIIIILGMDDPAVPQPSPTSTPS